MNPANHAKKIYLLDEMSRFVSSKGLISHTYFLGNSKPHMVRCGMTDKSFLGGHGSDVDFSVAMIKSMAEALERYALSSKANGTILYNKSYQELKQLGYNCWYPDHQIYEDSVYEHSSYIKKMAMDLKADWVASQALHNNKLTWIPASLMYCNNGDNFINPIMRPTSNGMACSFFNSAIESSVLELVERDAFLYMWLCQNTGEEILFDHVQSKDLKKMLDTLDFKMKQIKLLYQKTDTNIHCVYAVFKGDKKYDEDAFSITGNAHFDIERACYGALIEMASIHYHSSYRSAKSLNKKIEKPEDIKNFTDRILYYSKYENFNKNKFWFESNKKIKISELIKNQSKQNKNEILLNLFKQKTFFAVDVTPKEMEKSNFSITRAYSPDLLDIEASERLRFHKDIKQKRVQTIDKALGRKTKSINMGPHPYP